MRRTILSLQGVPPAAVLWLVVGLAGVFGGWSSPASADDRALFQSANASPYVFMIMDISGSMTWDAESGDTPTLGMDDPESRIYQAKRSIYQVLEDPQIGDSLRFGWATFDRGQAALVRKRWIYTPASNPPWYPSIPLFGAGAPITFGDPLDEDDNEIAGGDQDYYGFGNGVWTYRGCGDETGSETRIHDFPKLDRQGRPFTVLYYQNGGEDYRIIFHPLGGAARPGDEEILVRIRIDERDGRCNSENSGGFNGDYRLLYNTVVRMVPMRTDDGLDPAISLQPFADVIENGYGVGYGRWIYDDYETSGTCSGAGWESSFDDDLGDANPLSYDRQTDPLSRGASLARGDVIPWDWRDDAFDTNNREEILFRLAPNLSIGEEVPDFRAARYWSPDRNSDGVLELRPEFEGRPPLMPAGSTPLAQSMEAFGDWFEDWVDAATSSSTGDERFLCRQRYVVLITDGADTCNSQMDVCDAATRLREQGNRVFVVGYAFGGSGGPGADSLTCIADNGGTGAVDHDGDGEADGPGPIFVDSPEELVEQLREVFITIQSEATTVSAAAVPSVKTDIADRLFLTEFIPLERSVWPGRLDTYVAPLPVDADGLPDRDERCVDDFDSGCLAWEAQEVMVGAQYDATLPVGPARTQRRVYYSELREAIEVGGTPAGPGGAVPAQRHFWQPIEPSSSITAQVEADLTRGLGIDPSDADSRDQVNQVLRTHLTLRSDTLPDGTRVDYLLGDIFHSDPLLVQAPANTAYLAMDLMGDPEVNCEQGDPNSYRCFALYHERRRKVIAVGSNDGMLHAFDAGNFHLDPSPNPANDGRFDHGTGREIFAYMPRVVMPTVKRLTVDAPRQYQFTVDGSPVAADVFVDPVHDGLGTAAPPVAAERQWRTVVMGGMRRGGGYSTELVEPADADPLVPQIASGYYLLDMTQPDPVDALDSYGDEPPDSDTLPDVWVPSVADVDAPPACLGSAEGVVPASCGPVAYGAPLWEFNDTLSGQTTAGDDVRGLRLDEDDNGWVDLAPTWSIPVIARVQVCTGGECDRGDPDHDGDLEDRYVALFGGGYDPLAPNLRGNFFYMVDIETGTTLYKRRVFGSVASRPVVQMSVDGYVERVYFATTLGLVYRLDLLPEIGGAVEVPVLAATAVEEHSASHSGTLQTPVRRIIDPDFEPVILFNANGAPLADVLNGTAAVIRPIYLEPGLVFVLQRNASALVFGTGNREDIFLRGEPSGRFFAVVDDVSSDDLRAGFTALDEGDLVNTTSSTTNDDILLDPDERGWWLELGEDERLVGTPFAVAGVLFFSTYTPTETLADAEVCTERGFSRVYGVFTASSDPLLVEDDDFVRSLSTSGLVTKPFAVPYHTQNKPTGKPADPLSQEQIQIFERLKELFPDRCRFPPGMRLDINVRAESTGLEKVASVPICVIETAFREGG